MKKKKCDVLMGNSSSDSAEAWFERDNTGKNLLLCIVCVSLKDSQTRVKRFYSNKKKKNMWIRTRASLVRTRCRLVRRVKPASPRGSTLIKKKVFFYVLCAHVRAHMCVYMCVLRAQRCNSVLTKSRSTWNETWLDGRVLWFGEF